MSETNLLHRTESQRGPRQLLDVSGAANYLGTSERHIRRLVAERRIPFSKLGPGRGARLRFDTARLDEWIEAHSFKPEEGR